MPLAPRHDVIAAVSRGAVISFPTDTVAAFAARPDRADRVFALKQRSPDKPLILMGGEAEALWPYVVGSEADRQCWQTVAGRYWPGALTLVLPASPRVPAAMNPIASGTIGLRVPDCAVARSLLRFTEPLATTSANRSGEMPLDDPQAIATAFPEAYVLDDQSWSETGRSGLPSTVVRWQAGHWQVLRQGGVSFEA